MNNSSGAFRRKRVYFTQVSNEALRDNTLSLKAKGLYALIQSYITIENFTLYKNTLKEACKEGEKAFESAWKELKDQGYLIQYKLKDKKGQIYYEYDLVDTKVPKENNEDKNNENNEPIENTEKFPHPQKVGYGKTASGKGGVFNNTDLNNTYSMYVCMYKKHLKISKEVETFLANNEIDKRMDLDLFEKVLVEVMNNSKVKSKDNYFLNKIKNLCNKGIKTIEQYKDDTKQYNKSKVNTKGTNSKASKNQKNSSHYNIKTRFHNINEHFRDYEPEELERLLLESQKGKF